jgi:hypothetical protein
MRVWSWAAILLIIALLPLFFVALFAWWIARQNLTFEQKAKAWEVFISLVSAITVLVGGALVINKYIDEQTELQYARLKQEQRLLDFRKAESLRQQAVPLQQRYDRMRKLYDEDKKLVTYLAGLDESQAARVKTSPEREQFEQMYWAQLIGVEGPDVEAAMVQLRGHFETWAASGRKPVGDSPETDVHQAALNLSHQCENELKQMEEVLTRMNRQIAELTATPPPDADKKPASQEQ